MTVLFYGFLSFCCAFFIHLAVWKFRVPLRQTDAIFKIFILFLLLYVLILRSAPGISFFGIAPPQSLPDLLRMCIFYITAMSAYIITYSAVEANSPSLAIVLKIAVSGKDGLDKNKLKATMTDEELLLPRLNDLVRDGLAVFDDNRYRISGKGSLFISIFIFFRKLLGAAKGG